MAWLLFLDYQRVQLTPRLPLSNFGEANQPLDCLSRISEKLINPSFYLLGFRRVQSIPRLPSSDCGEPNRRLGCLPRISESVIDRLVVIPRFSEMPTDPSITFLDLRIRSADALILKESKQRKPSIYFFLGSCLIDSLGF